MGLNFPSKNKIKGQLEFCEKQCYYAKKNGNLSDYLYWDRKLQAGKFLLATLPILYASIFISGALILYCLIKGITNA